jgi:hypothetical protein
MNWYLAKTIFKIHSAHGSKLAQFDEQLTLIEAECHAEALVKARAKGILEEAKSLADGTQATPWEFINVAEIEKIAPFQDGIEVYSRVHETSEEHAYVNFVHHQAAELHRRLR